MTVQCDMHDSDVCAVNFSNKDRNSFLDEAMTAKDGSAELL